MNSIYNTPAEEGIRAARKENATRQYTPNSDDPFDCVNLRDNARINVGIGITIVRPDRARKSWYKATTDASWIRVERLTEYYWPVRDDNDFGLTVSTQ